MATKTEKERLAVVETKIDSIIEEIRELKKLLAEHDEESYKQLNEHIKEAEARFAPKWVQIVVSSLIGLILTAFMTALISYVIIPRHDTSFIQICERYIA